MTDFQQIIFILWKITILSLYKKGIWYFLHYPHLKKKTAVTKINK